MRSKDDLLIEAKNAGLPLTGTESREQIMDLLRDHYSGYPPHLQIDPMKARDLKALIDWTKIASRYDKLRPYFTSLHVMEPKYDGCRIRWFIQPDRNQMNTGRRSDVTYAYLERGDNFPHFRDADLYSKLGECVFDCELLAPHPNITTETGIVTHSLLNASVALVNVNPEAAVRTQEREGLARLIIFDILMSDGEDVTERTYGYRRALLERLFDTINDAVDDTHLVVEIPPVWPSDVTSIDYALELGFEGVMIKTKHGKYEPGKRSSHWLKVKRLATADAYVTGWIPGKGRNEGQVGALVLSVRDPSHPMGEREVAQPGAFSDQQRGELTRDLAAGTLMGRVVEFSAQGRTKNGKCRHPQFLRFRPDKAPYECKLEDILDVFEEV